MSNNELLSPPTRQQKDVREIKWSQFDMTFTNELKLR